MSGKYNKAGIVREILFASLDITEMRLRRYGVWYLYSGLTLNQDKATKPQIVQIETFAKFPKIQIVRKGEAALYWFKVNPL
ncbi:hypothetical protein HMPREF2572_10400 [Neisseria sp. HMSC064E01]|nr:hypothetical protein HMPREF2572_10400 [Neisseria sp. HMSC064E01]